VALLDKMSEVAAAGFCPFIAAAAPQMFGFDTFEELNRPRDLEKIFQGKDYIKWRSFREKEDSRFVVLTMPRVLARLPYGAATKPIDEFEFEEVASDEQGSHVEVQHDHYTWMNCAYALGARLTDAFSKTNWCTQIRGYENGGVVENLPVHVFTSPEGDREVKCPTEVLIPDRRDAELSKLGFLALCNYKNTDFSVFFGGQTTQKPKKYDDPSASANAEISARLPYMLASGRIAHFLKCAGRDKLGSFMEREDLQDWLNRWIKQYVLSDEKPKPELKAKFPLREAQIQVTEIPGKPGAYNVVAHMRPWLQLEELNASLRMVASIPQPPK
jgi:type VI secretion system protein ImpC